MGSYIEGDTPKKDGFLSTPIATTRRPSPGIMSKDGSSSNNIMPSASFGENSAYTSSIHGESSNILVGAGGILMPRNSILMNPSNKKTFVDAWRLNDGSGPAVLHIPAPQTAKDRELEREKEKNEREREIERELKEMEQAEKVWGIPKKAFYMGLGDINFNAQMAMLGGWGNGSGPATDFRPNLIAPLPRRLSGSSAKKASKGSKSSKKAKSIQSKGRDSEQRKKQSAAAATAANVREEEAKKKAHQVEKPKEEQDESDESMDPEELAALNAIINTRRSMEAAQALASRNSRLGQLKKNSDSQVNLNEADHLESQEGQRREEWQASKNDNSRSMTPSVHSLKNGSYHAGSNSPLSFANRHGSDLQKRQDSHIRFAPLPQAYGVPSPALNDVEGGNPFDEMRLSGDFGSQDKNLSRTSTVSDMSGDEDSEEEETWSRRFSGIGGGSSSSRNRWYLMGMPKNVFRSQGSNNSRTRRLSSASGIDPSASGESLSRSPGSEQILSNGAAGTPPASAEQRRGRRTKLRRSASAANSLKSRSSSVGSVDDEDRRRRRELIRASRPGGTGMVTLPDGTRIKARRVGEDNSDDEDFNEWGFAGLSRRSMGDGERPSVEAITGDERASDDEQLGEEGDDSGSGMSWVKRRRREREQRELSPKSQDDVNKKQGEAVDKKADEKAATTSDEHDEAHSPRKATSDIPTRPPVNPLAPTPTLSASRAAEVRRRHEQEVAALGAEVLESIAKAKKAKMQQQKEQKDQQQQQQQQQQQASHSHPHPHPPVRSMTLDPSLASIAAKAENPAPTSPTLPNGKASRGRPSRTTSLDEYGSHVPSLNSNSSQIQHQTTSKRSASQTTAAGISPTQVSYNRHLQGSSHTAGESSDGTKTPTGMQTPTPARRRYQSPPRLTSSPPPVVLEVPDIVADEREMLSAADHSEEVKEAESSPKKLPDRTSIEGRPSLSSISHESQLGLSQSPGKESIASLHSRNSIGRLRHSALPIPSPDLPRRPDARGYSVVPLPVHQLGRRPERPTEGRVWQFDDLDDSSEGDDQRDEDEDTSSGDEDEQEEGQGQAEANDRLKRGGKSNIEREEDEDEEESAMNAEELAEEERRTAIQKQRATTRAAGAELVSGMAKSRAAKKGNDRAVAPHDKKNATSRGERVSSSPAGRRASSTGVSRREQMGKRQQSSPKVRSTMSSSALSNDRRDKGKSRSGRPLDDTMFGLDDESDIADEDDEHDNEAEIDDENALSDASDDVDLWPPTLSSTTQLSRTLSAGEVGTSADQTRRGSVPTTMQPSDSGNTNDNSSNQAVILAAHSAKAKLLRRRKSKEAKEKERLRILRLKENDEYLDYGWPRSLQGSSLYD